MIISLAKLLKEYWFGVDSPVEPNLRPLKFLESLEKAITTINPRNQKIGLENKVNEEIILVEGLQLFGSRLGVWIDCYVDGKMDLTAHQLETIQGWLKLQNWRSKENVKRLKQK